jgi:hypothetical protein
VRIITANDVIHAWRVPAFDVISHRSGDPCLVEPGFLEGMNLIASFLV